MTRNNEDFDDYTKEFAEKDSKRSIDLAKAIIQAAAQLTNNK